MPVGKGSINRVNNISQPKENSSLSLPINEGNLLDINKLKSVPTEWFSYDNSYIDIKDIKASIKKYGVLEPVVARVLEDSSFQLLSGYKRVKAVSELGLTQIKGEVLQDVSEENAKQIFLELHKDKPSTNTLHKAKFTAISKIKHDLPEYLL